MHLLPASKVTKRSPLPLLFQLYVCVPMEPNSIRTVNITRYLTPLREGGSLPAIAEADDDFLYVLKFRGAGQGVKALIAELIGGELARLLGLKVPEIVFAMLDESFGRMEGDEEIQDLLKASTGLNLGLHYLSGSVTYDPAFAVIDTMLASKIVWLDCLLMNVDRSFRNTNMLWWHKELWLIDHGAALYFHHNWDNWQQQALRPFAQLKDHVLLPLATEIHEAHGLLAPLITKEKLEHITSLIPGEWLVTASPFATADEHRQAYIDFLLTRLSHPGQFLKGTVYAG